MALDGNNVSSYSDFPGQAEKDWQIPGPESCGLEEEGGLQGADQQRDRGRQGQEDPADLCQAAALDLYLAAPQGCFLIRSSLHP